MNRIFAIFVSAVCMTMCYEAGAQNDVYLVSDPLTARWTYLETDGEGKPTATIYNSIQSVEGDGVNGSIKLRVEEIPVTSPKDTATSFMFYRFKDGEFMTDVGAWFEDIMFDGRLDSLVRNAINEKYPDLPEEGREEVLEKTRAEFLKVSGQTRGVPRYPTIGKLPDYKFHIKVSLIGMTVIGEERRVVGRESIQTEAGLFDCFVVEETLKIKAMMVRDVEKIRSWYAYGVGMVKEMTYDKNGKLISTMILNEFKR
jgi:hypothetical protein